MLNILLTMDCNLNCSYCFAQFRRDISENREMSLDELDILISGLEPKRDPIRLLGGEPTLHSEYKAILKELQCKKFDVTVFTNGLQKTLRKTDPYLPDRILLNLNPWNTYTKSQQEEIRANLDALGERVGLGFTILDPDFDLSIHRHLIQTYGLIPVIRLGIAQPVVGGKNAYLPDKLLFDAHQSVVFWATRLAEEGIRLSMDCGFMRCQFTEQDIENLVRAGTVLNFDCSPTWDVGPGLKVWRCFAFSACEGIRWQDIKFESQVQHFFGDETQHLRDECQACHLRINGWCKGGCLARTLKSELEDKMKAQIQFKMNRLGVEA